MPDREEGWRFAVAGTVLAAVGVALLVLLDLSIDLLPFVTVPDAYRSTLRSALVALVAIAVVWILLRILGRLFQRLLVARGDTHAHARSVWRIATFVAWAIVLVAIGLGSLGDVASTTVSLGILGAALAFVLQKPLLNVAAWFIIMNRRLYRIGDRVAIGATRGYVTDIRLMHTELQEFGGWMHGDTFTGRTVAVPNSLVFDGPVYNYTRDFPFVWDEVETLVTYESDREVAKEHILAAAREVVGDLMAENYDRYSRRLQLRDLEKFLLRGPEIRMEFADSGVKVYVLYFCPVELRRKVKSDIVERVWTRLGEDPRVGIAYPHLEILRHTPSGGGNPPGPP